MEPPVTAIAAKVIASALKVFPQFNASVDSAGEAIVYKKYIHVGIAVDTENGLLVPVIRNVGQKNLIQLSVQIQQLAEKAKARKLSLDEMSGGSMSISNLGGIGGTGVLTIGALLGMAAHLDSKAATILDMTGLAQKGGAVTSHVRIGLDPARIHAARLGEGMMDVLIAADMIVGSGAPVLKNVKPGHTAAVLNTDVAPTGAFQFNRDLELSADKMRAVGRAGNGRHLLVQDTHGRGEVFVRPGPARGINAGIAVQRIDAKAGIVRKRGSEIY